MPVLLKQEIGRLESLPHVGNPVYPTATHLGVFCRRGCGRIRLFCKKAGSPASSLLFPAVCGFPVACSAPQELLRLQMTDLTQPP